MLAGTIRNTVHLIQLDNKWQQKKSNIRNQKKELTAEEKQLQMFQEQAADIRESKQYAQIDAKIKSGGTLTPEEKEYLRKKNPEALRDYEEIKREKEVYEKQLKSCRTKEEVERLKFQKMGNFMAEANQISRNPYIPKSKKVGLMGKLLSKVTNVAEAYYDFKQSQAYRNLFTEEEVREERQQEAAILPENSEIKEDSGITEGADLAEDSEITEGTGLAENGGITEGTGLAENGGITEDSNFEQIQIGIRDFLKKENVKSENMDILV